MPVQRTFPSTFCFPCFQRRSRNFSFRAFFRGAHQIPKATHSNKRIFYSTFLCTNVARRSPSLLLRLFLFLPCALPACFRLFAVVERDHKPRSIDERMDGIDQSINQSINQSVRLFLALLALSSFLFPFFCSFSFFFCFDSISIVRNVFLPFHIFIFILFSAGTIRKTFLKIWSQAAYIYCLK